MIGLRDEGPRKLAHVLLASAVSQPFLPEATDKFTFPFLQQNKHVYRIQARIAQLVAYRLGTGEVLGSNLGKGKNFSMNISN